MTTWDEVLQAVSTTLGGDRPGGGAALRTAWDGTETGAHGQRCVLAHYLADLEGDVADEVAWDERALAEHAHLGDDDLAAVGIASAAGFAPSLHLNLGDGYRRQGRLSEARREVEAGEDAAGALGEDGYGAMVRGGLARLRARVEDGDLAR
ncbi:hypothetical protein [Phycicoccus flavus]|uniref:hypothetical protein n=1 Tax=Phycicoccus flavus TaxID=2502783 RepID=UPI000FEBCEA3|nr:hypothetical protein [Phycicoccus flavus]NHA69743.1 hypothetical protein [Phycicoccus flavus]